MSAGVLEPSSKSVAASAPVFPYFTSTSIPVASLNWAIIGATKDSLLPEYITKGFLISAGATTSLITSTSLTTSTSLITSTSTSLTTSTGTSLTTSTSTVSVSPQATAKIEREIIVIRMNLFIFSPKFSNFINANS